MAIRRDIALNVLGDIKDFASNMKQVPGVTDREAARAALKMQTHFARQAAATARDQKKMAATVATAWKTLLGGAAAVISSRFLTETARMYADATRMAMDYRNQLSDTAVQTALSTETLGGLGLAAEASGGNLNELLSSLRQFPKRLDDFRRGTGEAKPALEALGFSAEDMDGALADVDGTLRDVLRRLKEVPDDGRRAAMAVAILGESGGRLNQVLSSGALEDWIDAAKLGIDVSEDSRKKAAQWQTAVALLSTQWRGFKADIVDALGVGTGAMVRFGGALAYTRSLVQDMLADVAQAALGFSQLQAAMATKDIVLAGQAYHNLKEGLGGAGEAADGAHARALAAKTTFEALARALIGTAEAGDISARDLARTSEELKADADAAKEAAAARAKLIATLKQQRDLVDDMMAGARTEAQQVEHAFQKRLEQIAELNIAYAELGKTLDTGRLVAVAEMEKRRELAKLDAEAAKKAQEEQYKANQARMEAIQQVNDMHRQWHEERVRRELEYMGIAVSGFNTISDAFALNLEVRGAKAEAHADRLTDLHRQRHEAAKELQEAETEAAKDAAQQRLDRIRSRIGAERKAGTVAAAQAQRAAVYAKRAAQASVALSTAEAIMKAFAMFGPPPSPAGVAAAGAAAAQGLVQTVAIEKTQTPSYFGGGVNMGGPRSTMAILHQDEGVLNSRAVDMLGREVIAALNAGLAPLSSGGGSGDVYLDGMRVGRVMAREAGRGDSPLRGALNAGPAGFVSAHGRN